jgi:acyl-CoA reductase-like NAD-dependent aldehyde dehydrogenase
MSPTKKRQTMGKMARERERRERQAMKQEKKDGKKLAAAADAAAGPDGAFVPPPHEPESDL